MKQLAVVGDSQFTLGFELAGIRNVYRKDDVASLLNSELGIVVIDQQTMDALDKRVRDDVVKSLSPVFVAVSNEANQEELRKMIIQSIGIDVMKD